MGRSTATSFREEFTFEERLKESQDMLAKYPDRVPVVAERYCKADLPNMEKKKYLVPRDMSVGQFIYILSRRLQLASGKALFVFVNNTLPQTCTPVNLFDECHSEVRHTYGRTFREGRMWTFDFSKDEPQEKLGRPDKLIGVPGTTPFFK